MSTEQQPVTITFGTALHMLDSIVVRWYQRSAARQYAISILSRAGDCIHAVQKWTNLSMSVAVGTVVRHLRDLTSEVDRVDITEFTTLGVYNVTFIFAVPIGSFFEIREMEFRGCVDVTCAEMTALHNCTDATSNSAAWKEFVTSVHGRMPLLLVQFITSFCGHCQDCCRNQRSMDSIACCDLGDLRFPK